VVKLYDKKPQKFGKTSKSYSDRILAVRVNENFNGRKIEDCRQSE